jgi:tripartite-type tricarboxylate transporter receptor subunit TctC
MKANARVLLLGAVFALSLCSVVTASAQSPAPGSLRGYPNKLIRMVVPFAPAGIGDMIGRAIARKLADVLGQEVIVDNRGGAGGNIGMGFVAKSAPDGYTLVIGNLGTLAINPALYKEVPFDPVKSFDPISLAAGTPLLLVVHPSIPARTVKELIALARARPGQLNYASAGTGGPTHLAGEMLKFETGVYIVHVPYKGNIAALTALVGGETHMMITNILTPLPFMKAGRLRGIAVTSKNRQPAVPDLPTVQEAGIPGFEVSGWYGVLAPAGTPRDVIMRLNAEVVKMMRLPDIDEQFVRQGIEIFTSTPEQFAARIKSDIVKWGKVVRDARATVD